MKARVNRIYRRIPNFVRAIGTGQAHVTLNVTLPGQGPGLDPHTVTVPGSVGCTRLHLTPARVTLLSPEIQSQLVAADQILEIQ